MRSRRRIGGGSSVESEEEEEGRERSALASHQRDAERLTAWTQSPTPKKYKWFDTKSRPFEELFLHHFRTTLKRQLYLLKPGEIFQPRSLFFKKTPREQRQGFTRGRNCQLSLIVHGGSVGQGSRQSSSLAASTRNYTVFYNSTAQTFRLRQTRTLVTLHHQLHARLDFRHLATLPRILGIRVIPAGPDTHTMSCTLHRKPF